MLYEIITIKDKDYKCRLNAKACVDIEKKVGTNPLNIFTKCVDGEIPSLTYLLTIFHASLQEYQHGITMEDVYKLYDDYCEDGGNILKFTESVINIFKAAGFMPADEVESVESKN